MRRAVWLVTAAVVVLVLAGCSEGGDTCSPADRPAPPASAGRQLPVLIPPQSQAPGMSGEEMKAVLPPRMVRPSAMDQVQAHLMAETLNMAGVAGKIRPGECEQSVGAKGEKTTYRCTVVYEGIEVSWQVRFTDADAAFVHYQASPVTGVLTAEAVYATYGWIHSEKDLQPRCDKMPKVFRAEVGKATGYRCQILLGGCHNGTWSFHWENQPVTIDHEGRVSYGETGLD